MRQFKEFNHDGDNAVLEVFCYRLLPGEVEELLDLLSDFVFYNIQQDTIMAKFEGSYENVYYKMQNLRGKGFSWREEE